MKTLTLDLETTGFPNSTLDLDSPAQPHLVEIGCLLHDDGHLAAQANLIVRPDGWTIPEQTVKIHGITQEQALRVGVGEHLATALILELAYVADTVIAHNVEFDLSVLEVACARHKMRLLERPTFCTMNRMTDICHIPRSGGGWKWPSLQEAYAHIGGSADKQWHSALTDAKASHEIYRWLQAQEAGGQKPAPGHKLAPIDARSPQPQLMPHAAPRPAQRPGQAAYDDDTPMPFGRNKGVRLAEVSASDLHWLWTKRPISDKRLEKYIADNIPALKKEYPDGIWD